MWSYVVFVRIYDTNLKRQHYPGNSDKSRPKYTTITFAYAIVMCLVHQLCDVISRTLGVRVLQQGAREVAVTEVHRFPRANHHLQAQCTATCN